MSKYLVVIDMQKDFIDGVLGTKEARELAPRLIEKVKNFQGPVMFTRDTHDEDYLQTQEGTRLPVLHCVRDTDGWQLLQELADYAQEKHSLIFDKGTFGSANLAGCLSGIDRVVHIDEVELIGVCTDLCVISNAMMLKAALPETRITVNASLCAGSDPHKHDIALEAMKACQIDIIDDKEQ